MLTTDTGGAYEVPQAGRGAQPAEAKSGARQEPVESPMTHVQPAPGHPPLFPHSPPLFGSNLMPRVSFSCIFIFTRGLLSCCPSRLASNGQVTQFLFFRVLFWVLFFGCSVWMSRPFFLLRATGFDRLVHYIRNRRRTGEQKLFGKGGWKTGFLDELHGWRLPTPLDGAQCRIGDETGRVA